MGIPSLSVPGNSSFKSKSILRLDFHKSNEMIIQEPEPESTQNDIDIVIYKDEPEIKVPEIAVCASDSSSNFSVNSVQNMHDDSKGHLDYLKLAYGGPRRASVAVWADEKLKTIANNISRKEDLAMKSFTSTNSRFQRSSEPVLDHNDNEIISLRNSTVKVIGNINSKILINIVQYLKFDGIMKLRRVCRDFQEIIMKEENQLLLSVDFSYYPKKINDQNIILLAHILGENVQNLSLKNCWAITDIGKF